MTSQLNALIGKLRGSLMVYYFEILSLVIFAIRHWQTSGRMLLEQNICSVHVALGIPVAFTTLS